MPRRRRPAPAQEPVQLEAGGGEIPIPKAPRGAQKGKPIRRYSLPQINEQLALVEQAVVHRFTERQIQQMLAKKGIEENKPWLLIGMGRVCRLKARIFEQMKRETERTRPQSKEKQLRRLYADLARLRQATSVNYREVSKYEELIAKIEGNFEPIVVEVDVVHREAVANVIGSLTEEQMQSMVASFDKMAALAEQAAKARGEKMPIIVPALRAVS